MNGRGHSELCAWRFGINAVCDCGHEFPWKLVNPSTGDVVSEYDSEAEANVVVSPRGIARRGKDGGETRCGIDATRDGWWWPL